MNRTYLHPFALRLWHWTNAAIVVLLLITGIELHVTGIPDLPLHSRMLLVHRYAGWAMAVSALLWLVCSIASGHLHRYYAPKRRDIEGIFGQAKFYAWSVFLQEQNPHRPSSEAKFNPLQKLAYNGVMFVLTPIIVITGLLFSDIAPVRNYMLSWNIAKLIDSIHVICAYLFALYLIVHLYMATLGRTPFSHIKAMITGFEEESDAQ